MGTAPDTDGVLAKILGGPPQDSVERCAPTADSPTRQSPVSCFVSNKENVERCLGIIAIRADKTGHITTEMCVFVLREEFGFSQNIPYADKHRRGEYNAPYTAMVELTKMGVLLKGDKWGWKKIPADTLRRLRHTEPENEPTSTPPNIQKDAPMEPCLDVNAKLTLAVRALLVRIEEKGKGRQQLTDIEAERLQILSEIERLQQRDAELERTANSISAQLENSCTTSDEETYQTLLRLIGEGGA